jgi:hypothetical protein
MAGTAEVFPAWNAIDWSKKRVLQDGNKMYLVMVDLEKRTKSDPPITWSPVMQAFNVCVTGTGDFDPSKLNNPANKFAVKTVNEAKYMLELKPVPADIAPQMHEAGLAWLQEKAEQEQLAFDFVKANPSLYPEPAEERQKRVAFGEPVTDDQLLSAFKRNVNPGKSAKLTHKVGVVNEA